MLKKLANLAKIPIKKSSDKYKVKPEDEIDIPEKANIIIIKDDNVVLFVKNLFTFLKEKNMCFLSGTIIFQDNNNELFNFLTFNKKTNNNCDGKVKSTKAHITTTHKNVYDKINVTSAEICVEKFLSNSTKLFDLCTKNNTCFKMEYVLNNKINYLCDQETKWKSINPNNISTKRVILYYRFKIDDKTYLFFKLEEYSMEDSNHVLTLINKNRHDTYHKRRENEIDYEKDLKHIDDIFYENQLNKLNEEIFNSIKDEIDFYNLNLRTGRELFIYEELKQELLDYDTTLRIEDVKIEIDV